MQRTTIKASIFYGFILQHHLQAKNKYLKRILDICRKIVLFIGDRPVKYNIDGIDLLIPYSHLLPFYKKNWPLYDTSLSRFLEFNSAGRDNFVYVDIGANVGDTALPALKDPNINVIAIEGNRVFTPFLDANLAAFGDRAIIVQAYVGFSHASEYKVATKGGTARLVPTNMAPIINTQPLSQILERIDCKEVHCVKIDTDGFDIEIIRSSKDFLRDIKPDIFFEFDPRLFRDISKNGWDVFKELADVGYTSGICYLNTGQFVGSIDLQSPARDREIRSFLNTGATGQYLDIIVSTSTKRISDFLENECKFFEKFNKN